MVPETGRELLMYIHTIYFSYFCAILILIIYHIICKPTIKASRRSYRCQKCKFVCLWGPFLLFILFCQVLAIAIIFQINSFQTLWIDTLTEMEGSYSCTFPSIEIDLEAFIDAKIEPFNYSLNLILVNGLLFVFTFMQYTCHYRLMMQWYSENPKDGKQFARKIQVGIPPNASESYQANDPQSVSIGLTVPEADREVRSQPLAISKRNAVPAVPCNESETIREIFHLSVKENQTVI